MGAGHPEDQAVVVCVCAKLCYVHLSVILWAVAQQVRLSKGFSRQEYWSGLPFPSPSWTLTLWYIQNSKWVKDINIRAKAIRFFGENIGGKLHNTGVSSVSCVGLFACLLSRFSHV